MVSSVVHPHHESPCRLFGRHDGIHVLREMYALCTGEDESTGRRPPHRARLVLLTGPHGSGKRALAKALQPTVEIMGGYFVSVRINATMHRDKQTTLCPPRKSVWVNVVSKLIRSMENEAIAFVLNTYFAAPSDRELLVDLLGPLDCFPGLMEQEMATTGSSRHHVWGVAPTPATILGLFLGAVTTLVPLVLLLHHAELAEPEQSEAIQSLVALVSEEIFGRPSKGLLVLVSCNHDGGETDVEMWWSRPNVEDNREGPSVVPSHTLHQLQVKNLSQEHVSDWINAWCVDKDFDSHQIQELTRHVSERTLGNPQHIRYLLKQLEQEQFGNDSNDWLDNSTSRMADNVSSLFQQLCQSMDSSVQSVVETTSALLVCSPHDYVTCQALEMILQQPCDKALTIAENHLLLECDHGDIQFTSARLQEAAYGMIPELSRAQVHLRIGRRLWKNSTLKQNFDDAAMLFVVAQQLRLGIDLVTDPIERHMIVLIEYEAGKKAMQSGDFSVASSYFEFAISMARDLIWNVEFYDVGLALYNGAAEAYYSSGDFESMERMLNVVFAQARTFRDTIQANITLTLAYGTRNRDSDAVATASQMLDKLGEPLPRNPGTFNVFVEYVKLQILLRGKTTRFFSSLPTVTDSDKIAIMVLLNFSMMYSYTSNPMYSLVAMFSLIRRGIQHGMTGAVTTAISGYGVLLVTRYGRIEEGYRYGQIAVDLLERVESKAWLSRVYFMVYGCINPWMRPFQESIDPLLRAQRSALRTGDIEGSATCAWLRLSIAFYVGKSLASLDQEAGAMRDLMTTLGQTTSLSFLQPFHHLVRQLSGQSSLAGSALESTEHDENQQLMAHLAHNRAIKGTHLGNYSTAVDAMESAQEYTKDIDFPTDFYKGVACLALARESVGLTRRKLMLKGRRCLARLNRYAALCPSNFCNKRDLVHAELESIRG